MPLIGDALAYCVVARVERPLLLVVVLRGNHPPVPTCLCPGTLLYACSRLSSVSRSRRRSEGGFPIPIFHSLSDRCRCPPSYFVRSTRVSVLNFVCVKHTS